MKKSFKFAAMILAAALLLSGCADKNGKNENEVKEEVNKFINSEPGRLQTGENLPEDAVRINCTDYEEYRRQIAQEDTSAGWLSWEQFSALGEFYSAGWWQGYPQGCQYKYLYTDEATEKTWIYHVHFDKLPSKVTNIKEYYQWFYGNEWTKTDTPNFALFIKRLENTPTISSEGFLNSNLTNVDPNNPIFENCKDQSGNFSYYVDNILELYHHGGIVNSPSFFYNGWLISIFKNSLDTERYALDNTDPEILQKLVNANTYKEAIAELMDPANGNYDK